MNYNFLFKAETKNKKDKKSWFKFYKYKGGN